MNLGSSVCRIKVAEWAFIIILNFCIAEAFTSFTLRPERSEIVAIYSDGSTEDIKDLPDFSCRIENGFVSIPQNGFCLQSYVQFNRTKDEWILEENRQNVSEFFELNVVQKPRWRVWVVYNESFPSFIEREIFSRFHRPLLRREIEETLKNLEYDCQKIERNSTYFDKTTYDISDVYIKEDKRPIEEIEQTEFNDKINDCYNATTNETDIECVSGNLNFTENTVTGNGNVYTYNSQRIEVDAEGCLSLSEICGKVKDLYPRQGDRCFLVPTTKIKIKYLVRDQNLDREQIYYHFPYDSNKRRRIGLTFLTILREGVPPAGVSPLKSRKRRFIDELIAIAISGATISITKNLDGQTRAGFIAADNNDKKNQAQIEISKEQIKENDKDFWYNSNVRDRNFMKIDLSQTDFINQEIIKGSRVKNLIDFALADRPLTNLLEVDYKQLYRELEEKNISYDRITETAQGLYIEKCPSGETGCLNGSYWIFTGEEKPDLQAGFCVTLETCGVVVSITLLTEEEAYLYNLLTYNELTKILLTKSIEYTDCRGKFCKFVLDRQFFVPPTPGISYYKNSEYVPPVFITYQIQSSVKAFDDGKFIDPTFFYEANDLAWKALNAVAEFGADKIHTVLDWIDWFDISWILIIIIAINAFSVLDLVLTIYFGFKYILKRKRDDDFFSQASKKDPEDLT